MATDLERSEAGGNYLFSVEQAFVTTVGCCYYEFPVPAGWQYSVYTDETVLRDDEAAIFVYPHAHTSLASLQKVMSSSPIDPNFNLKPQQQPRPIAKNSAALNLAGMSGETGRLIGTLSPYGGGAFVLAVDPSGDPRDKVADEVDTIVSRMRYFRMDDSVAEFISGMYEDSQNNQFLLLSGGVFVKRIRGHHLTYNTNAYQESAEPWGMAATSEACGTWTVTGNRKQGTIAVSYDDGSTEFIDYLVTNQSTVKPVKMKLSGRDVSPIPDSRHPEIMQQVNLVIENRQRRAVRQ